ncbi:hypothetical protein RHGRI_015359 [Rhododendron griersonianum]|uniref:laccase n=1 Tax=Rhododendron griersonianum TaxID=479676 RepID=A0AAV6KD02_9ERIC|nr:hypothetical protein RHGRI_015359 [Rhododendron griersonianum]
MVVVVVVVVEVEVVMWWWRSGGGGGSGGGGEWWNANVIDVENQALAVGGFPNSSNAFTINGQPGDLYNCSSQDTYKLKVVQGETYLLRIINAALNNQFFFKIANHTLTVVAVDASYTDPMVTDVIVIAPGQTVDALLTADQPRASYYMAAHAYGGAGDVTTTGIITYEYEYATPSTPVMPTLPAFNDTPTAFKFYSNLTSLVNGSCWAPVPLKIDKHMFVTEGLGLVPCGANKTCKGLLGQQMAASMNNASFEFPTKLSMLQAFFGNVDGIYTTNFPKNPPLVFNYTDSSISFNTSLVMTSKSTKVTKLKFNSTVQIVLQNTALVGTENHPIHLHGFNFYVLAQGFGNYDAVTGPKMFNLVNPQKRNTIAVPVGGWSVIRFTANNPDLQSPDSTQSTLSFSFAVDRRLNLVMEVEPVFDFHPGGDLEDDVDIEELELQGNPNPAVTTLADVVNVEDDTVDKGEVRQNVSSASTMPRVMEENEDCDHRLNLASEFDTYLEDEYSSVCSSEVEKYLGDLCERRDSPDFDILVWWKNNSNKFGQFRHRIVSSGALWDIGLQD